MDFFLVCSALSEMNAKRVRKPFFIFLDDQTFITIIFFEQFFSHSLKK